MAASPACCSARSVLPAPSTPPARCSLCTARLHRRPCDPGRDEPLGRLLSADLFGAGADGDSRWQGQVPRTDTVVIGVILLASVGLGSYMAQSAPPSK